MFTSSFPTPLPPSAPEQWGKVEDGGCSQSTPPPLPSSSSHSSSAPPWSLQGLQREFLLQHLHHLLLFSLSPWCSQGSFSHSSPHPSLPGSILPFITQVLFPFPKVLTSRLWGSAELCGGLDADGWKRLCLAWGNPSLSSQRLSCRPIPPSPHKPARGHLHPIHSHKLAL